MYQITQLFLYRPLFMIQLLFAEFVFTSQLKMKKRFILKMILVSLGCIGISFLFPLPNFSYNAIYCSFMFFILFAVTVFAFKILYDSSFKDILFCTIAGYTIQHIAQEIYEFFNVIFNLNNSIISIFYSNAPIQDLMQGDLIKTFLIVFLYFILYLLIYIIAYFLFAKKIKKFDILNIKTTVMLVVVVLIVAIDIVFSAMITYSVPQEAGMVAVSLLHIYNIACCVLALILLFEWPYRKVLEGEITSMNQLRHHEKEQYFISKENVELINIKCHDLKHQLRKIAENNSMNDEAVSEIVDAISIYDSTYKTKNNALNVILMEKSLLCKNKGIILSCIVDGSKLDFISESDIYCLFGNLLENSIEAVDSFEKDKRSISLSIKSVNNFLIVFIYNYYSGEIKFFNNLPMTTKKDKNYHGYGMKSIQYIINKYQGEMSIKTESNIFSVSIAIPIPTKK